MCSLKFRLMTSWKSRVSTAVILAVSEQFRLMWQTPVLQMLHSSLTVHGGLDSQEYEAVDGSNPLQTASPCGGTGAEIECEAAGSRPAPVISWWRGKAMLPTNHFKVLLIGNRIFSVVAYTPTREDSGKKLRSGAENPNLIGSSIEASYILDVCSKVINSNQSLVFQAIQRHNAGRYTCVAINSDGESESNEVQLRVKYAFAGLFVSAAAHEMVQVSCDVDAHPSVASFRWSFNGSLRSHEVQSFVSEGGRSVASYVPREVADYGSLLCWAANEVGTQKTPCQFKVTPVGPPLAPSNCTLSNQTEEAFLAECREDHIGGPRQLYSLEVHDVSCHRLKANLTADRPAFWVQGVPASINVVLVLHAANQMGRSQPVLFRAEAADHQWESLRRGVGGEGTVKEEVEGRRREEEEEEETRRRSGQEEGGRREEE
ncbi:hypothetical protein HPB47_018682 [Ixodes persulcatus]|uniref:Uncharacterized protein n=1 Tax=Ixodes persulcatus TaxID=34615 RepID=A0AC60QK34_IXOPE|nr:hypothetical protein HPB47_018682 [Ixodes persulcatus]